MKNDYTKMNDEELELFYKNMQRKIEDLEDEREVILARSQGQHTSSKYVQSNVKRLDEETESINSSIKEVAIEIENRKVRNKGPAMQEGGNG
jgi:phage shock protein A